MSGGGTFLDELKKRGINTPEKTVSGGGSGGGFLKELNKLKKKEEEIDKVSLTDIAPVKEKEEEDLDFFDAGSFSDGYQFGDVTRAILGTVGDVGHGILKGGVGMVEGLTDLATYGAAGVSDLVGADELAEKLKHSAKADFTGDTFKRGEEFLDKYSLLGDTSRAVAQGVGQVGTILLTGGAGAAAGLSSAGVSALTTGAMGLSGMGSGMGEAYKGGATDGEAVTYGAISGAADAITELIFGGLGKSFNVLGFGKGLSSADDILAKNLSSKIQSTLGKNLVEFGVKASGEGLEEVLAGVAQAAGKKATYMSEQDFADIIQDENLLEQFVVGALTSGIAQGGDVYQATKSGRDMVTGLNKNEQSVIDKVYKDEIAKAEKDGKLTQKQKDDLYKKVVEDMDRGYISTEAIEEVLGNDSKVKDAKTKYDALQKESEEFKTLYNTESGKLSKKQQDRLAELEAKNQENSYETALKAAKDKLSQSVYGVAKDSRLVASYNEQLRAFDKFQADYSKFEGKKHTDAAKKTLESAIAAGANNTNRVHDLVDMAAQVSADTGKVFTFKSGDQIKADFVKRQTGEIAKLEKIQERTKEQNQKLADMKDLLQKVKSGEVVVDGDITADGIVLNLDSAKPLNRVVGHEITHSFEPGKGKTSQEYTELKDSLFAYAKSKKIDLKSKLKEKQLQYEGVADADPEAELVADLVGDFLFTDSNFVKQLSVENRNVFQRMWDKVKHLYKMATAGSKEARELERVKKAFEDAYRESATKNTAESGVKNSISRTQNMSWAEQIDGALYDGKSIRRNDTLVVGQSADTSIANDIDNKPLAIPQRVLTKASSGKDISHSIKKGKLAKLDEGIKNAPVTIFNPDRNAVVYVTNVKQGGLPIVVSFDLNAEFDGDQVHQATSIHLQVDTQSMLESLPESATVYVRKNELDSVGVTNNLRSLAAKIKFIDGTISQQEQDVKRQYSLSDSNGKQLTKEQQEYFKDSVVRDEDGNLKVMYHGTSKGGFTVFDPYHSKYGLFGTGFYFTDSKNIGDSYTKKGKGTNPQVYEAYLNIKNPLDMDAQANPDEWAMAFDEVDFPESGTNEDFYRALEEYYEDQYISKWEVAEIIQESIEFGMGYDGITHIGGGRVNADGEKHRVYIAFQSEQIKNTDNVKPTEDPDIRYSLSKDSDGNKLTKEQQNYFEKSKMRDADGNLKVMYHGSRMGGFHVFDPDYSDDDISLFFVDRNRVAGSYSGTSETYTAKTFRTAEDFNRFFAEIGASEYSVKEENHGGNTWFVLYDDGYEVASSESAKMLYEEFRDWSGLGQGEVNYKVYLNLTNPLVVDADGRDWNALPAVNKDSEQYAYIKIVEVGDTGEVTIEYAMTGDSAPVTETVDLYKKFNDSLADALGNMGPGEVLEGAYANPSTTREYAQYAKEKGYDGVIFNNIVDVGGYGGDYTPATVAIAFDANQVKSVANENPTGDADIRYSLSKETNEKIKDVGLQYDGNSQTVSYSMTSLENAFDYNKGETDYLAAREEYEEALAKSIAVDKENVTEEEKEKAKRYLDSLFLIHDMIADDRDRLDYEAAAKKTAWVSNAEYGGSIDFSTLCAKRRLFTGTFDAIQNALPNTVLNENDFLQIRNMLLAKELESPCSMCYVEGSRAKHGVYVEKFLKEYLATDPEWKPQIADFTNTTRLEQTRINHPEAYQAYTKAMNALAQRKPKEASVRTDYKGEILRDFKDTSTVAEKNKNGGVRFNSFSDFEIIHALDCMQVLTDMSRVGLNGQAYTKVKEFAEAFGNTGLKINLSLVAKDVDADGKLILDETNGMKYAEAMDIRSRYSENVGTVVVVFNDAQLKAALADNSIDYVLPFHRSQWKKSQYTMMGLPTQTRDYTMAQNDRIRNPKTGKPVKLSKLKKTITYTNDITGETHVIKDNIMPNQYWDFSKSGRENAQRYLDYINANGMTPKFDSVLEKVDGKWVLPEGAVGDGYFKLLIDFKMYDNDGWGSPQNPVVPEFNMPYIQQMLENYKGGHQAFPVAHDVVNEFVEGKKNGAFSLSNKGEEFTPGRNDVYGRDFRVPGTVSETENVADVAKNDTSTAMFPDDLAPMSDAQMEQNLQSLTDEDAPPEMDAPYYETAAPADPFADRDFKGVGKRNVNAYMYDNPEVKPFFQEEANVMLGELERTVKGEKFYSEEGGWTGTSRHTTEDIAYLLDMGYTYAQIEKGLKDIIEDHGAENNAMAKRIEFALNERLMNGYTDIGGAQMPANQDYINLLAQKQASEAVESQIPAYTDADAPMEDIAPVVSADIAPVAEEYEAIRPKKEPQPRMVRVDNGRPGEKQRKWVGTSTESEVVDGKVLPEDLDQELIHYQPISNKKTLGNANASLDRMGYEKSVAYLNGQFANNKVTLNDIALGERLIQEAVKRGDTKTAGDLIMDISILGTELGQKVQALSIIKRLTPEGQLKMLQKTVERGKAKKDKAFEGVEVTQDMIDYILKTYGPDGTYDQADLNKRVEDVKKQIADQMQVTKMDKVNAWRYLAMLGNPKTHIRNLVSNVAMRGTVAVKNAVARSIETIAPVKNRTKTWKAASEDVKRFAQQTTVEMKDIISGEGKYSEDVSIKEKREIFKNKILNGVYEFNSNLLEKEDWWFSKPAFTNSLSEYLTANGITTEADIQKNPEIIEKAKQYALEQSQIATFRQYSWLSNKINEIERKNTATNIAVGSILPFKKTPINIAKTGLSYSLLGFTKTLTYDIAQVKKGNMEASELVDHLAQNITGTALTLAGYMLASAGLLNGAGDDDKEGDYDYQLGRQAYSVNIGGATFSLSWLSPVAMPLFVGANAYEQLVEGKEWNGDVVVETLAQTIDPLSEMSFISSLDSVLSSYDSGIQKFAGIFESMGQNYATQFIPTLSSQVATVMDDTKRSTKVAADSDFKFFDETINKLMYKIPGLRNLLEPTTDIWGNEIKQSENLLTRAFETFLAPYAKREDIATEIDEEIKDLYSQTGDTGLIPSIPGNYFSYDGEKYEMSAAEYTAFKKKYGQTALGLMEQLFHTETYRNADSETRADMVNRVYDYARDSARKEYLGKHGVAFTNATKDGQAYYRENVIKGAIEADLPVDEYSFSVEYPEKYSFFRNNGISYSQYASADEDGKRAYSWAYENPGKYSVAKAVTGDFMTYYQYRSDLSDITADKNASGNSISGSAKAKKVAYINNLDLDYGQKIILFKSQYEADDTYNYEIVEYLNSREDISYEEMKTILTELGFTVDGSGNITW